LSPGTKQSSLSTPEVPLCVDLDGTLLQTDLLLESLAALLRYAPLQVLLIPFWLLMGKAYLKRQLARSAPIDPTLLPYNEPLLDHLRHERQVGRTLVLTTASDELPARNIAGHLGIFADVIASDGKENLKGIKKAQRLSALFPAGFDYAGNSSDDLPVWKASRQATVVNASRSLLRKTSRSTEVANYIPRQTSPWKAFFKELRPHHWVKNLLVIIPVATAHQLFAGVLLLRVLLTSAAFSLCASAIYVLNDLFDLGADRQHPTKRRRPLASGALPLWTTLISIPVLLAGSFGLAYSISTGTAIALAIYLILTIAYTSVFKRLVLLDVICLSVLYVWRVVAGHVATGIAYSPWLLSFSLFLFVSLTFSKRTSELHNLRAAGRSFAAHRGYHAKDLEQMKVFGTASAFSAAVVFTMYLNSETARGLYRQPELLWFLSPLLLYWVCRIWILASRGELLEDPVLFALKDRVTYMVAVFALSIVWLATHEFFPRVPFLR